MSISMCDMLGVPSVSTMWRASAASSMRSDSVQPVARAHALEQLLRAALLEGHHPRADALDARVIAVDADRGQPPVGKAERERQPDAAEADDRDFVLEGGIAHEYQAGCART